MASVRAWRGHEVMTNTNYEINLTPTGFLMEGDNAH